MFGNHETSSWTTLFLVYFFSFLALRRIPRFNFFLIYIYNKSHSLLIIQDGVEL